MPAPFFTTYDPDLVAVIFANVLMDGWGTDAFVSVTRNSAAYTTTVGVDGKVARNKMLDESAVVTIRLKQDSNVNDQLSTIYNLDRNTAGGAGVGPFTIRDNNGRTLLHAPEAWIQSPPDVEFAKETDQYEWNIECARLSYFVGGR